MADGDEEPPEKRQKPDKSGSAKAIAASLLARGLSYVRAASQVDRSERTLRLWYAKDAGFRADVERLRSEAITAAMRRLSSSMSGAASVLRTLLKSADENTKLKAARAILELSLKVAEHTELKARLDVLESKLGGDAPPTDTGGSP